MKLHVFFRDNKIFLLGPINSYNANKVIFLLEKNKSIKNLVLSSEGGDVNAALTLGEYLRGIPKFNIKVQGITCSAATFILASSTGVREMTRYSYLMYHLCYSDIESYRNNLLVSKNSYEEFKFTEDIIKSIILRRNSENVKAKDFYNKFVSEDKSLYINAKQALEMGFIDKIV